MTTLPTSLMRRAAAVLTTLALGVVGLVGQAPPAAATQSLVNISGQMIILDNLSSASLSRAHVLTATADNIIGLMMRAGDRIIVTDKYIAWLDLSHSASDVWAGGALRGLWSMQNSGEDLNFRSDGAWNELLPYSGNAGSGHGLIANTQLADDPATQFYSNREPAPVLQVDGATSVVYPNGVAYQVQGHLTNLSGSADTNTTVAASQSIAYQQRYDFGPTVDDIRVETYVFRDNAAGAAPVSVLVAFWDTARDWTSGYGAGTARPNRYSSANTSRTYLIDGVGNSGSATSGQVVDIPPSESRVAWWQNTTAVAGTTWWISESPTPTFATRTLKTTSLLEAPTLPLKQHVSTPAVHAMSLTFFCVHAPGGVQNLDLGWSCRHRYDLTTRP
ncbi:hypothetical protein [Jiangella muralis]|uniref:hypothetical protein n=1 Tax=Jiangella muralis TaxID=702383 RepID=UPI00069D4124|nr:hypothetical protein [Jiangella muralis]